MSTDIKFLNSDGIKFLWKKIKRYIDDVLAPYGKVKSVNNVSPDSNGNITLKTSSDGGLELVVNGIEQGADGTIKLPIHYITGKSAIKSLTSKMTDFDIPDNNVTASSYWTTANNMLPPWKMFDQDITTYWIAAGGGEQWVEYHFDFTVFVLDSIWMRAVYNSARQLENLKVEVSNNGTDYITVWEKDKFLTKANEEYTVPINYVSKDGFDRVRFTSYKECANQNYYIGVQEARIYGSLEPKEDSSGIVIDLRNYYTKEEVLALINGEAVTTDTE